MILVEGYLDLIMLDQAGYEGCVATCGTALTADQVQLMRRLSKTLCLCFDGDEAGRKAALKAAELLLPSDINARVVSLTDEADSGRKVDPDSFMRDYGPDAFKARIESALPLMDFIIDCYSPKKEGSIQDRGIAFEEIARRLALMSGDVQRGMYLAKISERLGIDERLAASRLAAIRRGTTGREGAGRGLEKDAQEGEGRKGPPKAEATLLLGSVTRSSLFDGIDTDRLAACMTDIEAASLLKGALAAAAAGSPMSLDALLDRVAGSGLGKTLTEMAAASGYLEGEEGRRAIRESADKVFRDWTGAQIAGVDAEIKKRSEAGDKDMSLLLARKTELARQLENLRGKRR
jgi:DNA primase